MGTSKSKDIDEIKDLLLGIGTFRVYFTELNSRGSNQSSILIEAKNKSDAMLIFGKLQHGRNEKFIVITRVEREHE